MRTGASRPPRPRRARPGARWRRGSLVDLCRRSVPDAGLVAPRETALVQHRTLETRQGPEQLAEGRPEEATCRAIGQRANGERIGHPKLGGFRTVTELAAEVAPSQLPDRAQGEPTPHP